MRFRYSIQPALGIVLAASLIGPLAALASSTPRAPTPTEIRSAVQAAKHSRSLWATVNICDTPQHPHQFGIRGQMPALGFAAGLYMTFEVKYRSPVSILFHSAGTRKRVYLGRVTHRVHQAGLTFTFTRTGQLAGTIEFQWKLDGKVIGQLTRATTGGHTHVDGGDPPGHSAATCTMG